MTSDSTRPAPEKPEELLAHADFVRGLARRLVADDQKADDVSQEALIAALEHPPAGSQSPRAWLARVIRNFINRLHRAEQRRAKREKSVAGKNEVPSTAEIIEREETRLRVVEEVLGLDEPYRSAIILKFYENLDSHQAAGRLKIPAATFRTRLRRGLEKLRARLDKAFGGDRSAWCLALAPLAGVSLKINAVTTAGTVAGTSAAAGAGMTSALQSKLVGVLAMSVKMKALAAAILLLGTTTVLFLISEMKPDGSQGNDECYGSADMSQSVLKDPSVIEDDPTGETPAIDLKTTLGRERLLPGEGNTVAVHGRVLDENMEPLEGARVRMGHRNWTRSSTLIHVWREGIKWEDEEIETIADGSFKLLIEKNRLPFTFLDVLKEGYNLFWPIALAKATRQKEGRSFLDDIVLPRTLLIRGRVVDDQGRPVAACRVGSGTLPKENQSHLNVRTDDQGVFHLPISEMRKVYVTAYLKGYGWSILDRRVTPGSGADAPNVTVVLKQCEAISGTVFDGDGTPAEGLEVHANTQIRGMNYRIHLSGRTDENGYFRFFPAPEGEYTILAEIPGSYEVRDKEHWLHLVLAEKVRAGIDGLSLCLPPLAGFVIELVNEAGEPVLKPGNLHFRRRKDDPGYDPEAPDWSREWDLWRKEVSLGPGIFGYPRIQKGLYDIRVWHRNYPSQTIERVEIPDAMTEVRVKVTLQTMQLIRGKVFQPDGTPAQGVKVLCERSTSYPSDPRWPEAPFTAYGLRRRSERLKGEIVTTDESGAFEFRLSARSSYPRNIYHLYAVVDDREIPMTQPIELNREHPQEEVEFILPGPDCITGRIEGRIQDSRGRALANALVVAWDGEDCFCRVRSDEEGRFTIAGLSDGRYIVDGRALTGASLDEQRFGDEKSLRRGAENLDKVNPFNATVQGGRTTHLDLIVQDPWNGVIRGRILCESRSLPKELEVSLICLDENGRHKEYDSEFEKPAAGDLFSWNWNYQCRKDIDPRHDWFHFQDLKAGRYGVGVKLSSYYDFYISNRTVGAVELALEASENREIDLCVNLASIQGEVRARETREPIFGALVHLFREKNSLGKYRGMGVCFKTNKDGTFFDDLIPSGEYDISIRHDRYATMKKKGYNLPAGGHLDGLVLHLEAPCMLKGIVKVPLNAGEKAPYRSVRVQPEAWEGLYTYADMADDGSFTATHLPSGSAKLIVRCRGRETITRIVNLPQQEEEELIITIF